MKAWSHYYLAQSIEDALHTLAAAPGPAYPVAGGTDLLIELQQGRKPPVHTLVDVSQIPELNCLEARGESVFIGAAVSIAHIVASPLVQQHAAAVIEACNLIGGPQVRNTATLGGNVAHALPAADGMISLVAMGALAEVAGAQGCRMEPMLSLFKGPGVSTLNLGHEILVGFHLPLRKTGEGSAFSRVMRPQGVALPILNMAAWIRRDADRIEAVRIAIGPSGPTPQRASAVEIFLQGKTLTRETLAQGREALDKSTRFRTSPRRATAEYRTHLSGILFEEVVLRAWERAVELEAVVR